MNKVRTWTDRSGSFKVDAQFIGLKDSKIHLHKLNGVKIAVPVAKMAVEDLEYVEKVTGVSLDEDKPVSDIIKKSNSKRDSGSQGRKVSDKSGAQVQDPPKKPEYDWFDFFLKCGVSPYQCERYSFNFNKDSMDEGVLQDITPEVLRNLGLKEGDILRVMKYLDSKYGRSGGKSKLRNVSFGGEQVIGDEEQENGITSPSGGLFSGPGGALKNNTRKGRPAPPVQTSDVVDSKVLQQQRSPKPDLNKETPESPEQPPKPPEKDKKPSGFDDDAWDVKPAKSTNQSSKSNLVPTAPTAPVASAPAPAKPVLTGAMKELSLLDEPLQPVVAHNTANQQQSQAPTQQQPPPPSQSMPSQTQASQPQLQQPQIQGQFQQQQPPTQQPQGATPAFFSQLNQQPTGLPQQQMPNLSLPQFSQQPTGLQQQQMPNTSLPQMIPQQTGQFQPTGMPRQRPQAPQMTQQQGSIMPPPPARPLSAPQNASQQSAFGPPPLQPQLTGMINPGLQNQMTSPTQTLNDLQRMRFQQQQQQQQQPQLTGFTPNQSFAMQPNGVGQQQLQPQLQPQMTSMPQQESFLMGQQTGSPFADPRGPQNQSLQPQITGFHPQTNQFSPPFISQLQSQPTGSINSVLSPPLQPQNTGINGFGQQQQQQAPAPPVPQIPQQFSPPPIPQQPTIAPLQPQKTGPAPQIKFGIGNEAKKLMPQPTGRRANLSQASKQMFVNLLGVLWLI